MDLDADAARVLELMRDRPRIETLTPEQARENMRAARAVTGPDPEDVAEIRALAAPGAAGAIPLRLYRAAGTDAADKLPVLVFFHGACFPVGQGCLTRYERGCKGGSDPEIEEVGTVDLLGTNLLRYAWYDKCLIPFFLWYSAS